MNDNVTDIVEIKERLMRIETLLNEKVGYLDTRVSKLEANQKWVALAVIGAVIAALFDKLGF
jgi:hypothetical protein